MYYFKRIFFVLIVIFFISLISVLFLNRKLLLDKYSSFKTNIEEILIIYEENEVLKNTKFAAERDKVRSSILTSENKLLETAKSARSQLYPGYQYSVSRVAIDGDNIEIDLGSKDGIKKNMAIISLDQIFIGVVDNVKLYSSSIKLISSEAFLKEQAIAVTVRGNEESFGIVEEYDSEIESLVINKIAPNDMMRVGDTIITSGLSTSFPKGLVIGEVSSLITSDTGLTKVARIIKPSINLHINYYVFIVKSDKPIMN